MQTALDRQFFSLYIKMPATKAMTTDVLRSGEIKEINELLSSNTSRSAIAEKYRKSETRSKMAIIGIAHRH